MQRGQELSRTSTPACAQFGRPTQHTEQRGPSRLPPSPTSPLSLTKHEQTGDNPVTTPRRGGRPWRRIRAQWLAANPDVSTCATCGKYVDRTLPGAHKYGPSVDHLIPLLLGGDELPTDPDELRLLHNCCNSARSNRIRSQLRKRITPQLTSSTEMRTSREW